MPCVWHSSHLTANVLLKYGMTWPGLELHASLSRAHRWLGHYQSSHPIPSFPWQLDYVEDQQKEEKASWGPSAMSERVCRGLTKRYETKSKIHQEIRRVVQEPVKDAPKEISVRFIKDPPRRRSVCQWPTKRNLNPVLFVGCLTSQQHASVSQGRVCSDNFTCCHTEIEVAEQTFHLT